MKVKLFNLGNISKKDGILRFEENSYVMFLADDETSIGGRRYKTLAGAMKSASALGYEVVAVEEFGAIPA